MDRMALRWVLVFVVEQAVQLFALGSLWSPHGQCMLHLGPHGQLGTVKGSFRDDIACMDEKKKTEREKSSLDGQLGTVKKLFYFCFMVVAEMDNVFGPDLGACSPWESKLCGSAPRLCCLHVLLGVCCTLDLMDSLAL